jgi:integral membrane protein
MKKTFRWFRLTAIAEGISFLILLGIAMPLKYFADMPMAVMICGMLHGVLFVAFVVMARGVRDELGKSWLWFGKAMLASILPFGTIVMDKQWKKEEDAETKKEPR